MKKNEETDQYIFKSTLNEEEEYVQKTAFCPHLNHDLQSSIVVYVFFLFVVVVVIMFCISLYSFIGHITSNDGLSCFVYIHVM